MMFESLPSGKPIGKEFMSKDAPDDKKDNIDFLISTLDWEKIQHLILKRGSFYPPPINIENNTSHKCQGKWVVYGKVEGQ